MGDVLETMPTREFRVHWEDRYRFVDQVLGSKSGVPAESEEHSGLFAKRVNLERGEDGQAVVTVFYDKPKVL